MSWLILGTATSKYFDDEGVRTYSSTEQVCINYTVLIILVKLWKEGYLLTAKTLS